MVEFMDIGVKAVLHYHGLCDRPRHLNAKSLS